MKDHAVVKVLLRSNRTIESPIMRREDAEKALTEISTARMQSTEIVLPWVSVFGGEVEAAHLEERATPKSSARERLG